MPQFKIKATAKADLKGVAKFTEQTWGRAKRNKYLTEIDQIFHRLAENPELGNSYEHVRAGYRVFPVGSHLIFYKTGSGNTIEIIRMLHKRMDVSSRLLKV